MNCPKCKTPSLRSVISYSKDSPLKCDNCGGFWVQIEQIPKVMVQENFISTITAPAEESKEIDAISGLCPKGHGLLSRVRIEIDEPFYLDRCVNCGGIWFDQGEWDKIATAHLLDDITNFWTKAWQKRQREASQQKAYTDWAKAEFGEDLFTRLNEVARLLKGSSSRAAALAYIKNATE